MSVGAPAPVRVSTRFTRSTSLELDYGKKELLDGYIVSPLAAKTLVRIVRDLSTEGGDRAWSLVGPYGCGKSSFLTFLAAYVSGGELRQTAATLLATQQREDSNGALQDWARLPGQAMVRI